ncbi:MAG: hypothetical protein K8F30_05520 [Taibaiella sp.]|nr:hypothetical protein [Taibaiella sp.]
MMVLQILIFGYVVWLGLYLIQRDVQTSLLRYAGLGLLVYGLMLAADVLQHPAKNDDLLIRLSWPLPLWLSAFWFLATLELAPTFQLNRRVFLVGTALLYGITAATHLIFDYQNESPQWGYLFFLAAVILPLVFSFVTVIRSQNRPLQIIGLAALFLALGVGALLLTLDILPSSVVLAAISLDLIAFGVAIAFWDASQQGETLWWDMLRSFDAAFFVSLLFGGQVALVILLTEEPHVTLYTLLFTIITAAIFVVVFFDTIQSLFDRAAFPSDLQRAREELRTTARTLPRVKETVNFADMDEEEFVRLTRRALSNLGNLPRLATNPLTHLPVIEERLTQRATLPDTLERAAELKLLLTESIERLKPRSYDLFGTTDEWRYYNAVYFPYVAGIKPYSRRMNGVDPSFQSVLDWFQSQVPERTLHNWQKMAAQLIAQDLKERL